jgi:glucan 1,3-beta-glucosidase
MELGYKIGVAACVMLGALSLGIGEAAAALPMLRAHGTKWVDVEGNQVLLKGCNLGNWLLQEMWMHNMGLEGIPDQYTLERVLGQRFGEAGRDQLMRTYLDNYITARDFETISSFRMNVVRLPILHTLLASEEQPYQLKSDAWLYIDRAIEMAETKGIYTILDLHGAPGGQNPWHHSGREEQSKLWGSGENKRRTVWLWEEMAKRYRGRSAVAGYDLLNEPYTAPKDELRALMLDIYAAIRKVDPDHIVIFPSMPDGFEFYGRPADLGLTNVAFDAHFYPGLFGWGAPTAEVHTEWLTKGVHEWRDKVEAAGVPLLVGEMNVVFRSVGGAEMMRRSFDTYASFGWGTTMWSYKAFSQEGGTEGGSWAMVTNYPAAAHVGDSSSETKVDMRTSSLEEIDAYFRSLSVMEYQVYEELRQWLTAPKPPEPLNR